MLNRRVLVNIILGHAHPCDLAQDGVEGVAMFKKRFDAGCPYVPRSPSSSCVQLSDSVAVPS